MERIKEGFDWRYRINWCINIEKPKMQSNKNGECQSNWIGEIDNRKLSEHKDSK
jgi:hypothetical protein